MKLVPGVFFDRHSGHALGTQCILKFKCFQKSKFNARNTRAGNQKRDLPSRLSAPEKMLCVCFLNSIDHDVWISCAILLVNPYIDIGEITI